jgi:hypothetical protein
VRRQHRIRCCWRRSCAARGSAAAGANVEEIQHQRIFGALLPEFAAVELAVQTRDKAHVAEVPAMLAAAGFTGTRF